MNGDEFDFDHLMSKGLNFNETNQRSENFTINLQIR